jgi:lysophospholipase L1-like esterase
MRILVFGDSIGQGAWDVDAGGWVQRLKRAYDRDFANTDMGGELRSIFNLSISGDTTNEVLARFDTETRARVWRGEELCIIIAVGTNDARIDGEIAFMGRERYAANLETIITKAAAYTDKSRILLVGLPSCDEARTTPVSWQNISYTNERLEQFEQTAASVATAQQVAFVPIFEIFRAQAATQDLLTDGLHPDERGHQLIYDQVRLALDTIVKAV